MTGEPTTRVAIVGAGLAGAWLACLLGEAGGGRTVTVETDVVIGCVLLIAALLFVLGVLWGPNLT